MGGMTTTLYPSLTAATVDFILRNSCVRFLFLENRAQYQKVRGLCVGLPQLQRLILLDDDEQRPPDPLVISFAELLAFGARYVEDADAFAAKCAATIHPEDPAALIYKILGGLSRA